MSMYDHYNSVCSPQEDRDYGNIETSMYDTIYWKCKKNKSKSCLINFCGDNRKVYLNDNNSLTINCNKGEETYEEDGENNWRYQYIILNRGLYECENCKEHFDGLNDDNECKECCYSVMIYDWKQDMVSMRKKRKDAVKLISNRFLEWKYNPQYKYCRDRVELLYDMEFNSNSKPRMFQKKRRLVIVK